MAEKAKKAEKITYLGTDGKTMEFSSYDELEAHLRKHPGTDALLTIMKQIESKKKTTGAIENITDVKGIVATEMQYDTVFGKNSKINQAINAIKQRLGFSKTLTQEQIETICASNGLSRIESSMALTILRNQSDIESKRQGLLGFFGLGTEIFSLKR